MTARSTARTGSTKKPPGSQYSPCGSTFIHVSGCGAVIPGVVPGSWPPEIVAAAPAAHSASRLPVPKHPNAPAMASASSAATGSAVRRAKSSRPAYGCPATMAAAAAVPRLRTLDSPSLMDG